MSFLDRLRLNGHLDDSALVALWTDASLSGKPMSHPHLDGCASCRQRSADLSTWLEEVRVGSISEADEHFSRDRLAAQHAQIFRRLEAAERPARVIAFPRFAQPLTSRSSHASRWIAAAAAAGLIVGVGVGQLMDLRHSLTTPPARANQARLAANANTGTHAGPMQAANGTGRDEVFLSELDASLTGAQVPELRALDEFTPRAGDRSR